jgi:hypothetical protein
MKRNIPDMSNQLLFYMDKWGEKGNKSDRTPEKYEETMINLEKKIEKDMIEVLSKMGINASVKTDRYSLPYQFQIKTTQYGESYLNGAFESVKLYRAVLKEMTTLNLYKIRFYILAEVEDCLPMGKVNYYFNYYIH